MPTSSTCAPAARAARTIAREVVARHRQRQAAQRVVGAELDDHVRGLVLAEQRGQARAAARRRVAADAGVDHGGAHLRLLQALLHQRHPAAAARDAVLGRQAVAHHQHLGRLGHGACACGTAPARASDGHATVREPRASVTPHGRSKGEPSSASAAASSIRERTFHSMSDPIIAVERVNKQVRDSGGMLTILHDIGFTLQPRESAAIVGASGSGKSTLLGIVAGLDTPSCGNGSPGRAGYVRARRRRACRAARAAAGLRVPELPAARQPERAGERDAAAGTAGQQRRARARHRDAAAGRPGRAAHALPAHAVGRRAAARGAGARLRRAARRCCWPTSPPAASTSPPASA